MMQNNSTISASWPRSLFGFCLKIFKLEFALQCVSALAKFALSIILVDCLAHLVSTTDTNYIQLVKIGCILVARFILNACDIRLYGRVQNKTIGVLSRKFLNADLRTLESAKLNRVVSRDVPTFLEGCASAYQALFHVLALFGFAIYLWKSLGPLSLIAFLSLVLFIPTSSVLARISGNIFENVMKVSKHRIEKSTQWIEWRKYARNWAEEKQFESIHTLLKQETSLRNKDSAYKCLETYLGFFGRVVPVCVFVALVTLGVVDSADFNKIFWTSIPVISIIMALPRVFVDFKTAGISYQEIKSQIVEISQANSTTKLCLDASWDIWPGTLEENICGANQHTSQLLSALNLDTELMRDQNAALQFELESGGTNISAGQKARVLILRALNIAMHHKCSIYVVFQLNSLDIANRLRVKQLFAFVSYKIEIALHPDVEQQMNLDSHQSSTEFSTQEALITPQNKKVTPQNKKPDSILNDSKNSYNSEKSGSTENLAQDLLKRIGAPGLFFIPPAAALAYIGAKLEQSAATFSVAIFLSALALLAIICVSVVGFSIESKLRKWALERYLNIARRCDGAEKLDVLQKISRDFEGVVFACAFYIHDLGWIFALFAVSFLSLLWRSFFGGAVSLAIFVALCVLLWKNFVPLVVKARKNSVVTFKAYLHGADALNRSQILLQHSTYDVLNYRHRQAQAGFNSLYQGRVDVLATKWKLANYSSLSVGVLYLAASVIFMASPTTAPYKAFLISSLLAIDSEVLRLFMALSGYKSGREAINRLGENNFENLNFSSSVTHESEKYKINLEEFKNFGAKQNSIELTPGSFVSLIADSGVGKTQLLTRISGFCGAQSSAYLAEHQILNIQNSTQKTLYLDSHWPKIFAWLQGKPSGHLEYSVLTQFVSQKLKEGYSVFVFDEAFTHFSPEDTALAIEELTVLFASEKKLGILVDHRFQLPQKIFLGDLFKKAEV